jgi:hypothetical protein
MVTEPHFLVRKLCAKLIIRFYNCFIFELNVVQQPSEVSKVIRLSRKIILTAQFCNRLFRTKCSSTTPLLIIRFCNCFAWSNAVQQPYQIPKLIGSHRSLSFAHNFLTKKCGSVTIRVLVPLDCYQVLQLKIA